VCYSVPMRTHRLEDGDLPEPADVEDGATDASRLSALRATGLSLIEALAALDEELYAEAQAKRSQR
jgi:hypothetical protein